MGSDIISPLQSKSIRGDHLNAFLSSLNFASMAAIADKESWTCCVWESISVGGGEGDDEEEGATCGLGWGDALAREGDGDFRVGSAFPFCLD